MANSRIKVLIPMLVLCFFAVTAYGQAVLTLGSNPTRVRVEGITEVVGLITLSNNTNAAQVIPAGTVISVTFDGAITNDPGVATTAIGTAPNRNIYSTAAGSSQQDGTAGGGGAAQYLFGGACLAQPFTGCVGLAVTRSGATISITVPATFFNTGTGLCGAAPATATTFCLVPGGSLNIQGVRVNVSGLAGNILATLVPTPANALTFPGGNNQTVVGRAQPTIGSVVATPGGLPQCNIPGAPSTANLAAFYGATGALGAGAAANVPAYVAANTISLAVSEPNTFPTSFTSATNSGGVGVAAVWDEAGITPGGIGGAIVAATTIAQLGFQGTAPTVTKGVQLVMAFTGLPVPTTGTVSLIVPTIITQTAAATSGLVATLISPTPSPAAAAGQANVVALTSGAATVTYEVTAATATSPTTVDTLTFVFGLTASANTIISTGGYGSVSVSVGPVLAPTVFSNTAATLRFAANTGLVATPLSTVNACLTNLLFPFVSNRAGTTFNTGLAISNTAKDSGTTTGETGGVTLYFYGISAPTGGSAGILMPIPSISAGGTVATSGVVAPGEHTVLALNDGTATAIAKGFQGYIVALCNFRYAHGLATVFDNFGVGAANVGFSYLPLVLNGTSTGRTGANNVIGAGPDAVGLGN